MLAAVADPDVVVLVPADVDQAVAVLERVVPVIFDETLNVGNVDCSEVTPVLVTDTGPVLIDVLVPTELELAEAVFVGLEVKAIRTVDVSAEVAARTTSMANDSVLEGNAIF